ncbi:putative oxidoreductase [Gordonia effusa NBRC 100432]|uniref:Putative oxidoreductase n=1 Tax=Gordonia effusa NBRC 100432 TaxID=1077974 RepID=H0QWD2_9ACTN|nr:SDR family oxidoreductase [Gordonia effusa]GAB17133.1 putative oxidoreductase [Gordonia effusa NBRC 100432]
MSTLTGKTALVTGAARGIGRAIALRLAADGAKIAVHYGANAEASHQVVEEIEGRGGVAFAIGAQLGTPDDAGTLWSAFDANADGVDIVVNNAGILGGRTPFPDVEKASYEKVFAINTAAPFFTVQEGLSRLRDGGRIVNVSTSFTHGLHNPDLLPYVMSKAAIDAFTSGLAKYLGARKITVNAVGPGATATDMNAARLATDEGRQAIASRSPLGRVAQPDDIADIVAFLASDDARWITGQWIDASGGSLL